MKRIANFALLLLAAQSLPAGDLPDTEYFRNLPLFWSQLYGRGGETLYCGRRFGKERGRNINIEHLFPMSWVVNALNCGDRNLCRATSPRFNRIEADMHNLYPARAEINKARSALAYGMVTGEPRRFGRCDFEIDLKRRRVEPRPEARGNIARALFHMQTTWGLTIFTRQGKLLQQWHKEDPPDAEERRRNDLIEKLQGRRNRFIDHPEEAGALRFHE